MSTLSFNVRRLSYKVRIEIRITVTCNRCSGATNYRWMLRRVVQSVANWLAAHVSVCLHLVLTCMFPGKTPMGCAAINEQLICLKLLRKMGADVNVQDDQGRTCLSLAAYQVTSSCFMFCISTYLDLYNMSKVCLNYVSIFVRKNIFMSGWCFFSCEGMWRVLGPKMSEYPKVSADIIGR